MGENEKRNAESLFITTVLGILGVVTQKTAFQIAAYLPPIAQFYFVDKFNLKKELINDLRIHIKKTCDTTKKCLQQKNSSFADFFGYSCARIEHELTKDFSVENLDEFFKKTLRKKLLLKIFI